MVLALAKGGSTAAANSLTLQAFKVIIFFLLVYIVGFYARIPERFGKFVGKASSQGSRLSYLFTIMLSMMGIAQVAGLHMIIGAFFGGLMVNRAFKEDRETLRTTTLITLGFFAPFAYAWVGLNTIASTLISNLPLLGSILVAGVGAEILGGFLGSRCAGLRWEECLVVGVGLTGRAGIELAVIEVMREAGLITSEIFASFVILTALACLLMPFMLRFACRCAWRT